MVSWLFVAVVVWLFRYVRLIVNCISHWTYRPRRIPEKPTYFSDDATVVLVTIATGGEELETTIRTTLQTNPFELILSTVDANVDALTKLAYAIDAKRIRVVSIREANKRRQMCRAIPEVKTKITVFVDDDVIWPPKVLCWMLAPFEDRRIGGVGTSQRLKTPKYWSVWSFLGAAYLERRNFDCSACLHIDGGLPCLSGRTVAYRTDILQDETFTHGFTHEEWQTNQLNADDDNFITRWLYSHGWQITMQYHKEAEVHTTLEDGPKYLKQCLRWVRSNWRSNLTSMFIERHYWWTQPWSTYAVLQTTITAWALPYDVFIFYSWYQASQGWREDHRILLLAALCLWTLVFSKTVKIWGLFIRYPITTLFYPLYVAFGYYHGAIKLWGLVTLSETTWGSRDGADADNRMRMIPLPPYDSPQAPSRASVSFDLPETILIRGEDPPAYDPQRMHGQGVPFTT
ncbi:glycosyltransferase family 2 protein [Baudoinia panamericana UAMH 10762]|uniref:Glycosyltransferase family 2 protein n=1 Tax=Baudoinia panamericana (strain UAMH 10762) TaxID=717646 RepID=M2NI67_BAUPA|nr:glycosyltransferase family 2 protein [Baudoinia panamericana UAMH 10762]EMC98785.1 glycosyltransferase family 2 protein [Baudoinia panamericana UAMH 10762]